jgi:hypothetical protein
MKLKEKSVMKKNWILRFAICLAAIGISQASGQSGSMPQEQTGAMESSNSPGIPKLIWIYREDVKPARGAQHQKVEQGFSQFWASHQVEPFLALDSMSGNASEAMFISGYNSYASFEKDFQIFAKAQNGPRKAEFEALEHQEADLINGVRSMVARYRPELSYRADSFMDGMPKSRYFQIETMRVRPGKNEEFANAAKMFVDAYQKSSIDQPFVIYEMVSGAPTGTYLVFTEMDSLGHLDMAGELDQRVTEAMGESNMKNLMSGMGEVFTSIERNLYAFNPKTSLVSEAFAAADPGFWSSPSRMLARTADPSPGKATPRKKNK